MKKKPNPYDINRIFEQMTLDLIDSLKRNSLRHKVEETKEGFRWEQWQSAKLRAIGEYRKRNRSIVSKFFRKADSVVDDVLMDSFREGERRFTSVWRRMLRIVLKPFRIYEAIKLKRATITGKVEMPVDFTPRNFKVPHHMLPKAPMETDFFRMNEKKLKALQASVKDDLKKAEQGVMRKMDDVYKQIIYKAEVNMAAGAKTLNQAIDMATKEFLEKGINIIEYIDGRRVTISAYAEMALRTASQRATFLGEGKKRDEWGVYTVLMSAHDNCSPMCLPYQGTVMIDDVYTSITKENATKLAKETGYKLLSEAMKNYAFHPNCRHTLSTFFPGISTVPKPVEDDKAIERYDAEQKQRYMERQIRKYKRLQAGSVDEVNEFRYKKKVKEWQGRLEEHLQRNDFLRRDRTREKVG
ncbi:phage minor capsid protein [Sporosarcina sp. USHLN248]|uniref:phage minor capsid protein n=1 Tax=Sporosarcina sp. USHLN248 TaxID=3081300 RepID=UPI00301899E6